MECPTGITRASSSFHNTGIQLQLLFRVLQRTETKYHAHGENDIIAHETTNQQKIGSKKRNAGEN
jgi:hypothetical protein